MKYSAVASGILTSGNVIKYFQQSTIITLVAIYNSVDLVRCERWWRGEQAGSIAVEI